MNKFLEFDDKTGIYRLPLAYSLGDLDRIRSMFGQHSTDASIALPQLPPQCDVIDGKGKLGYLVYPPIELKSRIEKFLNHTLQHVRELKGKGYDYQHPLFKSYLDSRESLIAFLAERLEDIIQHERRLGLFNLFWLTITKQIILAFNEFLIKLSGNQKLKYLIHPHIKSLLAKVNDQVFEKIAMKDQVTRSKTPFYRGTLKSKLGANFNFNFVNDILNVQLSLLESNISPLDPLFQIRKILVDENSEYYISFNDFELLYTCCKQWLENELQKSSSWPLEIIGQIIGLPVEKLSTVDVNILLFEPQIVLSIEESMKNFPVSKVKRGFALRKKTLYETIGPKVWNQVIFDYIRLIREFQKAEIICFFRNRIVLLEPELAKKADGSEAIEGLEDRITYNINPGSVINDLRNVSLLFIDLRGFTQVASGLVSANKLKESLYSFFDPALDIIDHFKGQIRFFGGDAILATFGDNCAVEERTINAVRVGILIQRLLRYLVAEKKVNFEGVGIGIHVGKVENAYIFKNMQEKIDTVIGLAANITSRLSSGKSLASERVGDPTLMRELQDILQDILEEIKGKVSPSLREQIVNIFEERFQVNRAQFNTDTYIKLPSIKRQPGQFKVSVVGGTLDNNGVVLSDDAFSEIRTYYKPRSRPRDNDIEFIVSDDVLKEDIVFWRAGDALLKGIDSTIPVWSVYPGRKQ